MDWWTWLASLPEPRVMVIEDGEHAPGIGAFVGQIHVALARALNCVGCVTNGAVRDLDTIEKLTFPVFAGSIAVSHSYAHVVEFGIPVSIGGVVIHPADLIHGDRNGVHVIPLEIAEQVPGIAQRLRAEDNALIQFCAASDFSLQEFSRRVQSMSRDQPSLSFESDPAAPE
jgi:regulator of RNase E activity RraA